MVSGSLSIRPSVVLTYLLTLSANLRISCTDDCSAKSHSSEILPLKLVGSSSSSFGKAENTPWTTSLCTKVNSGCTALFRLVPATAYFICTVEQDR